eukprot:UN17250
MTNFGQYGSRHLAQARSIGWSPSCLDEHAITNNVSNKKRVAIEGTVLL